MEELLVVPCMAWSEVRMGAVVIRECVGLSLDQDRLSNCCVHMIFGDFEYLCSLEYKHKHIITRDGIIFHGLNKTRPVSILMELQYILI